MGLNSDKTSKVFCINCNNGHNLYLYVYFNNILLVSHTLGCHSLSLLQFLFLILLL